MRFYPNVYQKSIYDIPYQKLKKQGVKCLLFDLDNTLITNSESNITEKQKQLFKKLKKDFTIVILSNCWFWWRVRKVAETIGCDFFFFSSKPRVKNYKRVQKKYQLKKKEMCMIGDQLMTDIWAANRFGCYSCLIEPLDNKDLITTKVNRLLEKIIFRKYEKANIMKKGEYYG